MIAEGREIMMKVGRSVSSVWSSSSIRCMLSVTSEMWESHQSGSMTDFSTVASNSKGNVSRIMLAWKCSYVR